MSDALFKLGLVGLFVAVVYLAGFSDYAKERQRQEEADQRARQKPHVVREADGCKVYAFERDGRDHYFTRCASGKTATETTWEECQQVGKTRRCEQKSEVIE